MISPFALALPVLLATGTTAMSALAPDVGAINADQGVIYETDKAGEGTQAVFAMNNSGDTPDTLTAIDCQIADQTSLVGADGKPVSRLALAPGQTITLSPTGMHLVLQATHFPIAYGSTVPCTLSFANAGDIQVLLFAAKPPG
jgi:copper(I)-binding protein